MLARPRDIYAPFNARELRRLRRFLNRVEALHTSSFFAHPAYQMKGELSLATGIVENVRVDSPGEEAVRAVMPMFRELYTDSNPTSAVAVLRLLDGHVRMLGSSLTIQARDELQAWKDDLVNRKTHDPRGLYLEEDPASGAMESKSPQPR